MKMLNDNDIHLKFLMGLPVIVDGIGEFFAPLLRDIVDITEEYYNLALASILFDRSSLEVSPEEIKDLSDLDLLNLIFSHDISYREMFFCALELHFKKIPNLHESGFVYFDELSEDSVLTEDKFYYIKRLVKVANNLADKEKEEEIVAGNEKARAFMEKLRKTKELLSSSKKSSPINLHSTISAVGWKTRNFSFINELNIYQLYDGYQRIVVLDNYHYTMAGIYAGTVDGSKVKLPEINWANKFSK